MQSEMPVIQCFYTVGIELQCMNDKNLKTLWLIGWMNSFLVAAKKCQDFHAF